MKDFIFFEKTVSPSPLLREPVRNWIMYPLIDGSDNFVHSSFIWENNDNNRDNYHYHRYRGPIGTFGEQHRAHKDILMFNDEFYLLERPIIQSIRIPDLSVRNTPFEHINSDDVSFQSPNSVVIIRYKVYEKSINF